MAGDGVRVMYCCAGNASSRLFGSRSLGSHGLQNTSNIIMASTHVDAD